MVAIVMSWYLYGIVAVGYAFDHHGELIQLYSILILP